MEDELIRIARTHAERILLANGGELGLLGSNQAYQQVWSRDSMICGLGLWLTQDPEGRATHARSLDTLRRFQSPLGKIPHNVGMTGVSDPALIAHGGALGQPLDASIAIEDTIHAGCVQEARHPPRSVRGWESTGCACGRRSSPACHPASH